MLPADRDGARAVASSFSLAPVGDFDLAQSVEVAGRAMFVDPAAPVDRLDLTFVLDPTWAPVAVCVSQPPGGNALHVDVRGNPQSATEVEIARALRRILNLTADPRHLHEIAARDTVVASLVERFSGLRPISYPSPYEAAARAIIGHRLALPAAAAAARRVAECCGPVLEIGGDQVHAFPAPDELARLPQTHGLSSRKVEQLRALGRAAADGALFSEHLLSMPYGDALLALQELPGIGPFSAELIMIRGCGDPDVFPRTEPRLHRAIAELYDLGERAGIDDLEAVADGWRPLRSWIGLMARHSTADRSTGSAARPHRERVA